MSGFKKAGKQIDKLSQWTGERLFKEEKTQLSSSFLELGQEMDARTKGAERLTGASQAYVKSASKKDKLEDPELAAANGKEKVLPVEALGLVMIHFGESLGRSSEYGEALVNVGRAQCKVAAAQDQFADALSSSYLDGLERNLANLREYQAARKKLDSRRLAMDAANKRLSSSKKKDDRGLEEEVRVAKARFEEMQEDVEMRIEVVRGSEEESVHDLGSFLDAHLSYINQYRDILLDAKIEWSASASTSTFRLRTLSQPRPSYRASTYESSEPSPDSSRPGSSSGVGNRARSNSTKSEKGSNGGGGLFSSLRRKSKWDNLDEDGQQDGGHASYAEEDEDRDARRHGDEFSRRPRPRSSTHEPPSLAAGGRTRSAGATSTLSSFGGAGTNGSRALPPPAANMSRRNTAPLSPTDPDERVVRALYDFSGSASDELSLATGDIVVVASEVSDDWYQGRNERTGQLGIFPSAYTEAFQRPVVSLAPPLPSSLRPSPAPSSAPISRSSSSYGLQPPPTRQASGRQASTASSRSVNTDSEAEHSPYAGYSSDGGRDDDDDDDADEDDKAGLTSSPFRPVQHSRFGSALGRKGPAPPPPASRRLTVSSSTNHLSQAASGGGSARNIFGGRPSSKSVGAGEDSERNPFSG